MKGQKLRMTRNTGPNYQGDKTAAREMEYEFLLQLLHLDPRGHFGLLDSENILVRGRGWGGCICINMD